MDATDSADVIDQTGIRVEALVPGETGDKGVLLSKDMLLCLKEEKKRTTSKQNNLKIKNRFLVTTH